MKANELMIGDYINYRGQIIKITSLYDKRGSNEVGWSDKESVWVNADNVEPIPLTPDILEKNGFGKVLDEDGTECYRYYNRAGDGYIKISLYNGGDGDWGIEIVNYEKFDDNKIVYNNNFIFLTVHKLQHALRLCGIEKEIIL